MVVVSQKDMGQSHANAIVTGAVSEISQPVDDTIISPVKNSKRGNLMTIDVADKDKQRVDKTNRPIRKTSPGPLPSSRDPSDLHMITVTDNHTHFYMYSAFWDDRVELMSDPVIRITSMILTSKDSRYDQIQTEVLRRLRCASLCQGDFSTEISPVQSTVAVSLPTNRQNIDRRLVMCQPTRCLDYVTLTFDPVPEHPSREWILQNMLPVEHFQRPTAPVALGVCVSVMFDTIDPYRLVEWMEMMKLLGVKKVVAYNESLDLAASRVLNFYRDQGYVDIWQMDPDYLPAEMLGMLRSRGPLTITDCLYRYMFHFNRMMPLDVDELIIPRTARTLPDLIGKLDQLDQRKDVSDQRVNYKFIGSYFPVNDRYVRVHPDLRESEHMVILRHRRRLNKFDPGHVKSIMIPTRCLAARNHYCYVTLPRFTGSGNFLRRTVDTELGFVHHYRKKLRKSFVYGNDTLIQDDIILRYAEDLRKNIQSQLNSLAMPY